MAFFDGLFKDSSSAGPQPGRAPAEAVAKPLPSGKKVKLNFKRIPKRIVEAIADETTGQERPVVSTRIPYPRPDKGDMMNVFNKAASMSGDDDDMKGFGGMAGQKFSPPSPGPMYIPKGPSP